MCVSRHLFAVLVSELSTVRVVCPHPNCRAVTELTLDQLAVRLGSGACPVCSDPLGTQLLPQLARTLLAIQQSAAPGAAVAGVEFVLPIDPAP